MQRLVRRAVVHATSRAGDPVYARFIQRPPIVKEGIPALPGGAGRDPSPAALRLSLCATPAGARPCGRSAALGQLPGTTEKTRTGWLRDFSCTVP